MVLRLMSRSLVIQVNCQAAFVKAGAKTLFFLSSGRASASFVFQTPPRCKVPPTANQLIMET